MCYRQTAVVAILLLACAPDQPRPGSPTRESHRAGGVTELYGRPTSAAAMPFTSARRRPSGHRDPRWGGETEARGSGLSKTHHTPPPMTNVVAASEGTPHHLNVLLMAAQSQCTGKVRHRRGGGGQENNSAQAALGPLRTWATSSTCPHMDSNGGWLWAALVLVAEEAPHHVGVGVIHCIALIVLWGPHRPFAGAASLGPLAPLRRQALPPLLLPPLCMWSVHACMRGCVCLRVRVCAHIK